MPDACRFRSHKLFFRLLQPFHGCFFRPIPSLSGMTKVQTGSDSFECITVRYPVRKFQKFRQIFLTTFAKRLHIGKIFPSADDRTQSYDYDILQLMPDISVSGSSRLSDVFDFFFSSSILISLFYYFFQKK